MQRKTKLVSLAAMFLIAGTMAASAEAYDRFGRPIYPQPRSYGAYGAYGGFNGQPGWYGAYGAYGAYGPYGAWNGSNHPTPSSSQGDVGPMGNNNGTLTGIYSRW
jgi:hypothetical protein